LQVTDLAIQGEVDSNKVYTWAKSVGREFFGDDVLGKEASFYFEGEQDTYDEVAPFFSDCTPARNTPAPASACRSASGLLSGTAAVSGWNRLPAVDHPFISVSLEIF
jgi:hypothetical protein